MRGRQLEPEDRGAVIGLDPGSSIAGYALVICRGTRVESCRLGSWSLGRRGSRAERLARLAQAAEETIREARPAIAAVEGTFQHRNVRSALALAEARGVLLAVLGRLGVPTVEYSPATVKQAICGSGGAAKDQVRRALVRTVPGLDPALIAEATDDAVDALAIAVCHVYQARFESRSRTAGR